MAAVSFEHEVNGVRFRCPQLISVPIPDLDSIFNEGLLKGGVPYCNAMFPVVADLCKGQDVSCVGPFSRCPKLTVPLDPDEGPTVL